MADDYGMAFMSDREPGVFYIIRVYEIEDFDPDGWHIKICIEYYRDYGETLVDVYCHDVTKDYVNEVGVEELQITNYELQVYPNPTGGEIVVSSEYRVESIEIFDLISKKVQSFEFNVQSSEARNFKPETLNISGLPAGIYFVRIQTENGVVVRKVVKR
jgi:hypothetical protein